MNQTELISCLYGYDSDAAHRLIEYIKGLGQCTTSEAQNLLLSASHIPYTSNAFTAIVKSWLEVDREGISREIEKGLLARGHIGRVHFSPNHCIFAAILLTKQPTLDERNLRRDVNDRLKLRIAAHLRQKAITMLQKADEVEWHIILT